MAEMRQRQARRNQNEWGKIRTQKLPE